MKHMSRVALGSLLTLSLVFVTSCGEPPKADPKEVLSAAQSNFATYVEKDLASQAQFTENGERNAVVDVTFSNDTMPAKASAHGELAIKQQSKQSGTGTKMNAAIALKLKADMDSPMAKGNGSFDAEIRSLEDSVFFILNEAAVSIAEKEIQEYYDAMYKPIVDKIAKKWFTIPQALVTGGTTSTELDTAIFAKMGKHLKDNMLFEVVKELPSENGMYVYQVKPSKDGITAFVKALSLDMGQAATESELADLAKTIDELSTDKVSHKLYITTEKKFAKLMTIATITQGSTSGKVEATLESPKSGDFTAHVSFSTTGGTEQDSGVFDFSKTGNEYNILLEGNILTEKTSFSVKLSAPFVKKDTTIEAPKDAGTLEDLGKLMSPSVAE